jgi:glycosyltransferase involved in cell wall biosynthesis
MTVLLANKFHYLKGGAERYYLDLGEHLARNGERVVHLSMRHPSNLPAGADDRFVREVDYRGRMGLGARAGHALRSISNAEAAAAARGIVRAVRPDVAHLHNVYHQLPLSVVRALDAEGVPIVQTLHDYKLVCPAYLLLTHGEVCERCRGGNYFQALRHRCLLDSRAASLVGAFEAYLHGWIRTYDKIRLFLCPSRFMLEKVASFGVSRERLVHLPYFMPLDRYTPSKDRGDYYVYAGRLSREKGVATLLEAHARLGRTRPSLRVLGDGPLRGSLEARLGKLGLTNVTFEGHQSLPQLEEIVGRARFVVVPSEWYENYPYAILEAFALERPVVGARIGGIPELVRDGETGWTAPAGDPDGLAAAITAMIDDPARAEEMGRAARAWVASELDPESHMARIREIYAGVAR